MQTLRGRAIDVSGDDTWFILELRDGRRFWVDLAGRRPAIEEGTPVQVVGRWSPGGHGRTPLVFVASRIRRLLHTEPLRIGALPGRRPGGARLSRNDPPAASAWA